jgi:DNA-binding Lrp family transcriptional regulator
MRPPLANGTTEIVADARRRRNAISLRIGGGISSETPVYLADRCAGLRLPHNVSRLEPPIWLQYHAPMASEGALDRTDDSIVALLRENARRSFQDIGAKVGLSAPAVKRRVDRLESRGIIKGYSAILSPAALGWPTLAVVQLFCEGRMSAAEVEAAVSPYPEISAAFTVAGAASAVVLVRARDTQHLEETLAALRSAGGVLRTETSVVLSTLLDRPFAVDA